MGIPISNVTRRVVYAASGTGPYNFTFEILAAGDVAVYKDDVLLTITTDYTVTINANGTGYITLTASPTGATQIAIVGNRTIQRTSDFVTGGDFFANTVNTELDSLTIFAQQNAESVDRAMKAPQTDPTSINMTLPRASLRAGKTLAFDAQGNPSLGDTLGTNRGNWASGTLYYVRDIVKDTTTSNIWQCLVQHTSSGSQPISTNADAAKWSLLVDAAAAGASATAAAASASAAATSASNASTSASNAASSASTASTQASNASTSATNAANSATAAASSASTASTQASNAATSATNAANSATSASNSASTATTQATNASNSATSAATSASNASTSASNAASSASTATTQASNAATSATNAANSATASASSATNSANSATASANSATAAAGSATSAAASAAAAAASLDNFDDRYLGAKASNPTVDNDGDPLVTGALYYRTTAPIGMKVWDGSQWLEASAAQQASLVTYEYVATAGQTTFSGADANSVTLSYTVGNVFVSVNGVRLRPGDDFTASTGTSVVLVAAAASGDEVVIDAFRTFDVANTYTQAQVDAFAVKLTGNQTIAGVKTFSDNLGLGVTPSAWSQMTAMDFPSQGSIGAYTGSGAGNNMQMLTNAYWDGSNFRYKASGLATRYRQLNGAHEWYVAASGTAGNVISFGNSAMTLDASGRLGVGTTSPQTLLHVNTSSTAADVLRVTNGTQTLNLGVNNGGGGSYVFESGANALRFGTNDTERARIDTSGNLLVGTTTSKGKLTVQGQAAIGSTNSTPNGIYLYINDTLTDNSYLSRNSNGSGTTTWYIGNQAITTSSDARLKGNVKPSERNAVDLLNQWEIVDHTWNDPSDQCESNRNSRGVWTGVIAQQVQPITPWLVNKPSEDVNEDGTINPWTMDFGYAVPLLVKAIQEQQTLIQDQLAIITALTARVEALENTSMKGAV